MCSMWVKCACRSFFFISFFECFVLEVPNVLSQKWAA